MNIYHFLPQSWVIVLVSSDILKEKHFLFGAVIHAVRDRHVIGDCLAAGVQFDTPYSRSDMHIFCL